MTFSEGDHGGPDKDNGEGRSVDGDGKGRCEVPLGFCGWCGVDA